MISVVPLGQQVQTVTPNPKCSGCLHFNGQQGESGVCEIGTQPWLCGDGDAPKVGYAPVKAAGPHLPIVTPGDSQAPEVAPQEVASLYGAGSHRPVPMRYVTLTGEHVTFIKSLIAKHDAREREMCTFHQGLASRVSAITVMDALACECAQMNDFAIAKELVKSLSNRQREQLEGDAEFVLAFVRGARAGTPLNEIVSKAMGGESASHKKRVRADVKKIEDAASDIDEAHEDVEKAAASGKLRWKNGQAKTAHGTYHLRPSDRVKGGHHVTYQMHGESGPPVGITSHYDHASHAKGAAQGHHESMLRYGAKRVMGHTPRMK